MRRPPYTWRKAASVELSGTGFPASTTFNGVGVKKKSFWGLINSDKPCLHIGFGKFGGATASAAEDLIGSRSLTLTTPLIDGAAPDATELTVYLSAYLDTLVRDFGRPPRVRRPVVDRRAS